MASKVSRYVWPTAKAERLALIVANLTQPLPRWRRTVAPRPDKDTAEVVDETEAEADDENA